MYLRLYRRGAYMRLSISRFGIRADVVKIPPGAVWDGPGSDGAFSNATPEMRFERVLQNCEDLQTAIQVFHDLDAGHDVVKYVIAGRRLENLEPYPSPGYESNRSGDLVAMRAIRSGRRIFQATWNSGINGRVFEEYVYIRREEAP